MYFLPDIGGIPARQPAPVFTAPAPSCRFPAHQLHLLCQIILFIQGNKADIYIILNRRPIHALAEVDVIIIRSIADNQGHRVDLHLFFLDDPVRGGKEIQQNKSHTQAPPEHQLLFFSHSISH